MKAYYNEIDPYCAQWLRNLMLDGLIPYGDVDERSIVDVRADDLKGYTQCHFFAGLGGWAYALRLAGWDEGREVWTGSCPCQPFSDASVAHGGPKGQEDDRHLLPQFLSLIEQRAPSDVFGEQVASAIKWGWLDEAFGPMERLSYACAAAVLPACAYGARHERKRLYWVAHADSAGRAGHQPIKRFPLAKTKALTVDGDPLARAWAALDGDNVGVLPCDGLSVVVERCATRGYGNAIVPQVAAEFIQAYLEAETLV